MKKLKEAWDWIVAAVLAVLALIGAWALTRKTSRPVPGRKRLMHEIAEEQEREQKERQEQLRQATKEAWRETNEDASPGDGVDYLAEFYAPRNSTSGSDKKD